MPYAKWTIEDFPGRPLRSTKCLRWLVTERSSYLLHLYSHYEKGFLLLRGGIFDQPHVYTTAMQIIGSRLTKITLERMADGRRKNI
jgi:hypothetical protein